MPNLNMVGIGATMFFALFMFVILSGSIFSAIPENAMYVSLFVGMIPLVLLIGGAMFIKWGMG